MTDDCCGLAGCRRPAVITFYGIPLCGQDWDRYAERWQDLKPPRLRPGYKWPDCQAAAAGKVGT